LANHLTGNPPLPKIAAARLGLLLLVVASIGRVVSAIYPTDVPGGESVHSVLDQKVERRAFLGHPQ
jgi:hypothetical protein